jgi:hypothetical protein
VSHGGDMNGMTKTMNSGFNNTASREVEIAKGMLDLLWPVRNSTGSTICKT